MGRYKIDTDEQTIAVRVTGEFERWSMDRDELEDEGVDEESARYFMLDVVIAGDPGYVEETIDLLSPKGVSMDVEVLEGGAECAD